jgi:hypothetical protein
MLINTKQEMIKSIFNSQNFSSITPDELKSKFKKMREEIVDLWN